jgi:hypothetical protein
MYIFSIFFLLSSIYYFFFPLIFLFSNFLSNKNIFNNEISYISELDLKNYYIQYNFFSLIFLFLIFYILYKIFFLQNNIKKFKTNYNAYNLVIIICILFLLKDIFYLIKYYFDNENINRTLLYYELLNNRRTHLNLLIIISVINFKDNKILSYLSYFLISLYSLLSFSRIELFLLLFCHITTNLSYDKKDFLKKFLIIVSIFFFIFFYRFIISGQSFIYLFVEPLHLMISSMVFFKNLLLLNFDNFFLQNINFFLKDFFYLPVDLINYFANPKIPSYSIRGVDSLFCFFFVFLIYFFILKLLIHIFYINKYFLNCIFAYLITSLFRGNFVHNLNFIIKIYLLIILLSWIISKIQQSRLRAV